MLAEPRRQKVLELLRQRGFMSLVDLASAVSASESTLRRDLEYWDSRGTIKRTHGGAVFVGDGQPLPAFEERSDRQASEKRQIAQATAKRIQDGAAVLLDGGTTTLEVARLLVGRPVQVVTNSLPIAQLLASNRETDLVLLGGYVYPRAGVALGPHTVRMLEDIHVDHAVLGVSGITAKGLFNSNVLLVETERAMMGCAENVLVVADHTKIGRQALAFLCDLSAVTLIVDSGVTVEQRGMLAGTTLLVAEANGS